jgi:hypothetical protein
MKEITQEQRVHNYAIPYEGIDLFEAGVAVKSGYDS